MKSPAARGRTTLPTRQIAAICRARGATCATRNLADFEGAGVELVDPSTA